MGGKFFECTYPALIHQPQDLHCPSQSFPIYRHPADNSPPLVQFTPTVALIRDVVEKALNHPVNHVLIQLYRGGKDAISEHSDKTIDVVRGSKIVNVSLGAQRVMVLRTKRDAVPDEDTSAPRSRPTVRVPLPNNSMVRTFRGSSLPDRSFTHDALVCIGIGHQQNVAPWNQ